VTARPPSKGVPPPPNPQVAGYLEDAAHYPGGRSPAVAHPRSIEEVSALLRIADRVLPIGAQSSLTGGATPFDDIILATNRLTGLEITSDRVRARAGVPLQVIQDELAKIGRWLPPVPTYLGAFAGGAAATCAAGAATFKYGTVREWIEALTVVLSGGDVLAISRGEFIATDDIFEIATARGVRTVRIPPIQMPDVPKRSAGYFLSPQMDLIDLFIGSEGTLGVIADVTFRTAARPKAVCRALVPVATEAAAIRLVDELRSAAIVTWMQHDPRGIDIAAIEHIDARSIEIVREDGVDRKLDVSLPTASGVVLLIDLELPEAAANLWQQLASVRDSDAIDSPLTRFCQVLDRHGVLDDTEIALPDNRARAATFAELREAVPAGVNRRVALAKRNDPRISKTAADMIVPFSRFGEMMALCRELCAQRGLDLAVWGHISDGNVHPNVIPRTGEDVERGHDAILALGDAVIAMGGCPLAEHGVGRHPIKQALLRRLYGDAGVRAMRDIKLSLDPNGSLARGVIFPAQ
jgi:D-lactate dehydrogenase (cytochrome)